MRVSVAPCGDTTHSHVTMPRVPELLLTMPVLGESVAPRLQIGAPTAVDWDASAKQSCGALVPPALPDASSLPDAVSCLRFLARVPNGLCATERLCSSGYVSILRGL